MKHSILVSRRRGFTLVELLVVIAIIGVLVALLLPAVQAAREAARRMQCTNNVKQLVLATHNFHDTFNRFPPGAARDQVPFGTHATGTGWGSSWLVYILPFVEQNNVYSKLQFNGGSGYDNANNTLVIKGLMIPGYNCPSSPLKNTAKGPVPSANGPFQAPTYVGISGAVSGLIPNFTESRNKTGTYGIASGGGMLVPNGQTRMADMIDGTSNVAVVSEYSNFLQQGTSLAKVDWRLQAQYGFLFGVPTAALVTSSYTSDTRTGGMLTIRYPINQIKAPAGTGWTGSTSTLASEGVGNYGTNLPLNSAHPGGVVVGLGDGSIRFLAQSLPIAQLAALATRDDGHVLSLP